MPSLTSLPPLREEPPMLTLGDACVIADIVRCAQGNQPVTWMAENGSLITGTARAITHEGGALLHNDTDVRDGYLWISAGMEFFIPMREVMERVPEGTFALNYRA